jgi:hypothetical protein
MVQLIYQHWQHSACCDEIRIMIDELDNDKLLTSSLCLENQTLNMSAYYFCILYSLS